MMMAYRKFEVMAESTKITDVFDASLANLLGDKIRLNHPVFDSSSFTEYTSQNVPGKTYTQRVEIIADGLRRFLPEDYLEALGLLLMILGPENPEETGMFSNYYWILPIGKFVEKYGLGNLSESLDAIEEITKRNTGEYAIRPYIRCYPQESLERILIWSKSDNFHLRRLASEGLRPKLPWATKLDTFIENPQPVFEILEVLKEDNIKYVQKSVANHLTDYLKVNPEPTRELIKNWQKSQNVNTQWIINRATRKIS